MITALDRMARHTRITWRNYTNTPTPVSYTHLDVYKRQVSASAHFGVETAFIDEG